MDPSQTVREGLLPLLPRLLCLFGSLALDERYSGRPGCDVIFRRPEYREPCYVMLAYYEAVRAQDWAGALGYLSAAYRVQMTPGRIRADWSGHLPRRVVATADSTAPNATACTLIISYSTRWWSTSLVQPFAGDETHVRVDLVPEAGTWRIDGLGALVYP